MKNKTILSALLCLALMACNKKQIPSPQSPAEQTVKNKHASARTAFGVSVRSGRLHFTGEEWNKAVNADRLAENELFNYIRTLTDFKSVKDVGSAPENGSATHDDFIDHLVDQYYMLDIDDWTIKVDACREKFVAINRLGFSDGDLQAEIERVRACRYVANENVFEFSFNDELLEKLVIHRKLLNDTPIPEYVLICGEDACGDRSEVSWEDPGILITPFGSTKPIMVDVPRVYLRYKKHIFKGSMTVWVQKHKFNEDNIPMGLTWQAEFGDSEYKGICKDATHRDAGDLEILDELSEDTEQPRKYDIWECYYGKRLKAAYGSATVRVSAVEIPNAQIRSSWITIVF